MYPELTEEQIEQIVNMVRKGVESSTEKSKQLKTPVFQL